MNNMIYPYQEFGLDDLPNEQWDDIPQFDGMYMISNLGRIKRLEFEILTVLGYTRRLKSMILKQCLASAKNKGLNDYTFFLDGTICSVGRYYNFSVARMVYHCFVKPFALDDYSLVVLAKDGNGKNTRATNLVLISLHRKQKRIIERGRLIINRETSYDEYLANGKLKSENPRFKQVSQYTMQGKIMQTFPSIRVAAIVTGLTAQNILSVLKKRQIFSGSYTWGYGKKKNIDIGAIKKSNNEHRISLVGRKVTQYNLKGKRIAAYSTIMEASKTADVNTSDIIAVLKGTQRSAGGFIWREGLGEKKIDVKGFLTGEAWRTFRRQKDVLQNDSEGVILRTHNSLKDAASFIGISPSYISMAIKSQKLVKGCLWKFKI
jgi:hypothetical protein